MTLLNAIHNAFPEQTNSSHLQLLDNNSLTQKLFIAKTANQLTELWKSMPLQA